MWNGAGFSQRRLLFCIQEEPSVWPCTKPIGGRVRAALGQHMGQMGTPGPGHSAAPGLPWWLPVGYGSLSSLNQGLALAPVGPPSVLAQPSRVDLCALRAPSPWRPQQQGSESAAGVRTPSLGAVCSSGWRLKLGESTRRSLPGSSLSHQQVPVPPRSVAEWSQC